MKIDRLENYVKKSNECISCLELSSHFSNKALDFFDLLNKLDVETWEYHSCKLRYNDFRKRF